MRYSLGLSVWSLFLLGLSVCFVPVFPVHAAEAQEAEVLPELQVISGPFSEEEKVTTTNNFVIDEATIRNSNAANLSELLTEMGFPNEGSPTDYGENVTLIRGFQTDHHMLENSGKLLFLIDGKRTGVANARQLTLHNIERIEILRGPDMFKYSLGSAGGVINLVTKRGGPQEVGGIVTAGGGSNDAYKGGASLNGLAKNVDYNVGYAYTTTRGNYKDGDGDRVYNTKTDGTHNMNAAVGYTFNDTHRISGDAYYYEVDAAHRPSYVDEEGDVQDAGYVDRKSQLYHLNYEGATDTRTLSWHANVGYGKDEHRSYTDTRDYPTGSVAESYRGAGGVSYTSEFFDLSGGADYIKYDVKRGAGAANTHIHDIYSQATFGAYTIGTLKLFESKFNVSGGLRYEYTKIEDKEIGDEGWATNPNVMTPRSELPTERTFAQVAPSIGASYLPIDWLKLRANYTRGYRPPSGRQLFSAASATEGYGATGDPRLKAEKSDNYEVGFDIAHDQFRFSSTFFYNYINDNSYIYNGPVSGRICRNAEERIHSGLEVNFSFDVMKTLGYIDWELRPFFNMTYMFQKEEIMEKGGTGRGGADGLWWPILRMPDLTMNYGVRLRHLPSQFSANVNFNYYGEQYGSRTNATTTADYHDDAFGEFTIVNASVSKRLVEFGDRSNLVLRINADNIFNKLYSYNDKYPSYYFPGRTYYATLTYNF